MSRAPVSPIGKKLRTMYTTDDTDSDTDTEVQNNHSSNKNLKLIRAELYGLIHDVSEQSKSTDENILPPTSATTSMEIDHDGIDKVDLNSNPSCSSTVRPQTNVPRPHPKSPDEIMNIPIDDDDDEIDNTDDEGGVEDRSEDYEDIGEYVYDDFVEGGDGELNYMSSSDESSGYHDYHGWAQDTENESIGSISEDDENDFIQILPEEYLRHDPTPDGPYPKPDWITTNELRNRKYGHASTKFASKRPNIFWFENYASNSLWMIQRLQLERKMQGHNGPVNCLDFNSSGNLLCSGGDDLTACIWDWQAKERQLKAKIQLGHTSNVFQSRFCNLNKNLVTSARDGTVRYVDIETNMSELLLSSSGGIGQLDFITPQTLVTCGTNAAVHLIDLRTREATKLLVVRNPKTNSTFSLHSINVHPLDKHNIAVAGSLQYVLLYDLRRIARENHNDIEHKPTYCLGNNANSNHIVTSTAFNSTGDKLLISYNDDDLYVCRTDTCQIIHKYQGHRNKKTIKGCAWFGDNFVLSGSDDGHIYGWDLKSEHIVCFLEGDTGVVNCLCNHPNLPVLASSGTDSDVKLWEPVSNTWPQTLKGIKPQICKNTMRRKRAHERRIRPPNLDDDDGSDTDL